MCQSSCSFITDLVPAKSEFLQSFISFPCMCQSGRSFITDLVVGKIELLQSTIIVPYTVTCLWMSYLCIGQCASKRPGFSQVETMRETRRVPRAFTESCTVCSVGAKSSHQPHLTPIPRETQRFFETVQDKSTSNLDAPELEWKYLSGSAVKKGHSKPAGRGLTNHLLAPRRGPFTQSIIVQETMVPPAEPPEEPLIPDVNGAEADILEDQLIQFPPKMDENWLRYELLN